MRGGDVMHKAPSALMWATPLVAEEAEYECECAV